MFKITICKDTILIENGELKIENCFLQQNMIKLTMPKYQITKSTLRKKIVSLQNHIF